MLGVTQSTVRDLHIYVSTLCTKKNSYILWTFLVKIDLNINEGIPV